MEGLTSSFDFLQTELRRQKTELQEFRLRFIKLESDNRANQSEIKSLKNELNERKENEMKLDATVTKLREESDELKGKLGRLGQDASPPAPPPISNPGPSTATLTQDTGHNVLEMLSTLSTEIKSKFGDWNGKQVNLQKEVENLKQTIKDLSASPPSSTTNLKEERSGSPSLLADNQEEFDDYIDDDIQILSPPTLHTSPSTPDMPAPPPSPPGNNVEDAYAFVDNEQDDGQVPGFSGNLLRKTSPVQGPSTRLDDIPNQNQKQVHKPSKPIRAPRKDPRYELPHGKDKSDLSGLLCLCGTRLKTRRIFKRHLQNFTEEWRFRCERCNNRPFPRLDTLRLHLKRAHNIISAGNRFSCPTCGVVHTSRLEHRKHLRSCTGQLPGLRIKISNVTGGASNAGVTSANVGPPTTPPGTSKGPCYAPAPASKRVSPIKISIPLNPNRNNPAIIKKLNLTRIKKEVMGPVEPSTLHRKDPTREFTCLCGAKLKNNGGLNRHVKYYTIQRFRCRPCGRWFPYASSRNAHVRRAHPHQGTAGCSQSSQQF